MSYSYHSDYGADGLTWKISLMTCWDTLLQILNSRFFVSKERQAEYANIK